MKSGLAACMVGVVLVLGAASTRADRTQGGNEWRHSRLWDDGKAEFATYEVVWQHYGKAYHGRGILVLVKEPWAPDLQVKADTPRPDGFDVFKFNHLRDVPTGVYTYHQAATVFLRRDSGELVKMDTSSAEACGVSTAQMRDGVLETHSYFDGQGDRSVSWPAGAWPWEGLPAALRDFVRGEPAETLEVLPSLLTARFPELRAQAWTVTRRPAQRLQVPAGTFEAIALVLQHAGTQMTFEFDTALPHTLLRYRDSQGTEYRLAKVERMAYWQMNSPGDEQWYPPRLRGGFGE